MVSRFIIAIACGGLGFAGGWAARPAALVPTSRPSLAVVAPDPALLNQQEATDAVRRHPAGITPLDHAGVTLGGCDPEGALARCAIDLVWDERRPGRSQRRIVTFARIAGRWEVAI